MRPQNCKKCQKWHRERGRCRSRRRWLCANSGFSRRRHYSLSQTRVSVAPQPLSRKHTALLSRLASLIPNLRPFKQMSNYRRNKCGGGESERERVRYRSYDEKGKRNKEREGEHKIRFIQNTNKETRREKSPSGIRRLLTVLHDR